MTLRWGFSLRRRAGGAVSFPCSGERGWVSHMDQVGFGRGDWRCGNDGMSYDIYRDSNSIEGEATNSDDFV